MAGASQGMSCPPAAFLAPGFVAALHGSLVGPTADGAAAVASFCAAVLTEIYL
eukprot:COSAG01_NODE_8027_length_2949_cov_69.698947_1_plen_52_part_10